jgi:hypothetical protein
MKRVNGRELRLPCASLRREQAGAPGEAPLALAQTYARPAVLSILHSSSSSSSAPVSCLLTNPRSPAHPVDTIKSLDWRVDYLLSSHNLNVPIYYILFICYYYLFYFYSLICLVVQNVNAPAVQLALTVSSPEARTHEDSKDKHTKHAFEIDADKFRVLLTGTASCAHILFIIYIFVYLLLTPACSVSCRASNRPSDDGGHSHRRRRRTRMNTLALMQKVEVEVEGKGESGRRRR